MNASIQDVAAGILFEVDDVFGSRVRTTRAYWEKIRNEKHKESCRDCEYIERRGFVVTCYETTKTKRKGKKIW